MTTNKFQRKCLFYLLCSFLPDNLSLLTNELYIWGLCNRKGETTGKIKNELMPNLDVSQPKKHIWHIKVNLVFPSSFPPFYCKGLIYLYTLINTLNTPYVRYPIYTKNTKYVYKTNYTHYSKYKCAVSSAQL